jgi:integrase
MGRRARPEYAVHRSKRPNGGMNWYIIGRPDGKRIRAWFTSKEKAQAEATERNTKLRKLGSEAVTVDNALIEQAKEAARKLEPHGKTIMDAVRHYLDHLNQISLSVPFSALAAQVRAEFARRLQHNEVSDRHAESLNEALKKLETRFGERLVSSITTEEVRTWLLGLPLAAKTRNKHRGYAGQVFNLAVDYGYVTSSPVTKIKKFRERASEEDGEISILSAEETEHLFRAATPEIIPFLTLSFFCGIRRATLERLDWSEVKFAEKRAIVPRYKSKNQKRYRVTLSDNAIEWLRPYVCKNGSLLAPALAINRPGARKGQPSVVGTRRRILEAAAKAGVTLPDNGGRHTFISMHVAHYESIDKTALESDNSPEIIKADYLDVGVTREDADAFWKIFPEHGTQTPPPP